MIKQHWSITEEEQTHQVAYTCRPLVGKMTVTIDKESFTLKSKFLFYGIARREAFRVGDTQALLAVGRSGRAQVLIKGKPVEEN